MCTPAMVHVWASEDTLWEMVLSLYPSAGWGLSSGLVAGTVLDRLSLVPFFASNVLTLCLQLVFSLYSRFLVDSI